MEPNCGASISHALVFSRAFYDDSLLQVCEGAISFRQFLIRGGQFVFQREVPLYGFVIRPGGVHISGASFVFLEVDFP